MPHRLPAPLPSESKRRVARNRTKHGLAGEHVVLQPVASPPHRPSMEVEDLSRYEGRSSRAYYRALNMLTKLQAARQKQAPVTEILNSNPIPPGDSPGRRPLPGPA